MPSDSYPFAVGRIRGLERGCLDETAFRRLEEQPFSAAVKSLADSGYGQEAAGKGDPDALIDAEMKSLRALIEELTPDKRLTDPFWAEWDAINLKLLLKARLLREETGGVRFADGLFPAELLKEAVENRDYTALPAELAVRMDEVERLIGARESAAAVDPFAVSAAVDRAVYGYIFAELKKTRNRFVQGYFRAKLDFTNLLSLLRARALNWDRRKFETVLLPDGEIGRKDLLDTYDIPAENLERAVPPGPLSGAMKRGLAAYAGNGQSVPAASAAFHAALAEVAGTERHDPFGIGPVVSYLTRRKDEGQRLRVLFARKRSAAARRGGI